MTFSVKLDISRHSLSCKMLQDVLNVVVVLARNLAFVGWPLLFSNRTEHTVLLIEKSNIHLLIKLENLRLLYSHRYPFIQGSCCNKTMIK